MMPWDSIFLGAFFLISGVILAANATQDGIQSRRLDISGNYYRLEVMTDLH